MSSKKEIVDSRAGVTLTKTVISDAAAQATETYTVSSKWTPEIKTFDALADADACFRAEIARAPQRPSLYGERYKEN